MSMQFEWDETKAKSNLSKHKVSFDEAKTVFDDPFYIDFYDPDYSDNEERYIIIGQTRKHHLLFVSYTRLISAREATRKEKEIYEKN